MWGRKHEVWKRYDKDVIAIGSYDAILLSSYIRYVAIQRIDVHATEVINLQRYKVIRKFGLVKSAMRENRQDPFIFLVTLN